MKILKVNHSHNSHDKKAKAKNLVKTGTAIAGGYGTSKLLSMGLNTAGERISGYLSDCVDILDAPTVKKIKHATGKALAKSGLPQKGVSILSVSFDGDNSIAEKFLDDGIEKLTSYKIKSKLLNKFAPEKAADYLKDFKSDYIEDALLDVKSGYNAFFDPQSNKIFMSNTGLSLVSFHEMGHAISENMTKFSKSIAHMSSLSAVVPAILLISLLTPKKANDKTSKENEGKIAKTAHFIKRNAGKLTFAAFLPQLYDEALASLRGNKMAKEALKGTPELYKKVLKSNAIGFSTYLCVAVTSGLAAAAGVKVKDKIQECFDKKKENKKINQ